MSLVRILSDLHFPLDVDSQMQRVALINLPTLFIVLKRSESLCVHSTVCEWPSAARHSAALLIVFNGYKSSGLEGFSFSLSITICNCTGTTTSPSLIKSFWGFWFSSSVKACNFNKRQLSTYSPMIPIKMWHFDLQHFYKSQSLHRDNIFLIIQNDSLIRKR